MALGAPASTTFGQVPTTGRSASQPPTTRGGYQQQTPTTAGPTGTSFGGAGYQAPGSRPISGGAVDWSQIDDRTGTVAPNGASAWLDLYSSLAGPQQAWLEKNSADLSARLGMVAAKYGAVTGAARSGFDADMRLLDNQEAQHMIDVAAAARQPGLLDALYGVQQGRFGLGRDKINLERGFLGQQRDFSGRQRGLAEQGAELDYQRQTRNANDDFAARGAFGATGYGDTMNEYATSKNLAYGRAGLAYDTDMAAIDNKIGNLDLDERGIGLDENQARVQYEEDKAKAQDRIKTLDLVSASFGIKRDQLKAALDRTVAENGLGQFTSANQVLDMLNSNSREQLMIAESVVRQAISGVQSGMAAPNFGG